MSAAQKPFGEEKLEDNERNQPDCSGSDMEQPEGRRRHGFIPCANFAHDLVRREEGQIIDAYDRRVERARCQLCKESKADGQDMRKTYAVKDVEHQRPEQTNLAVSLRDCCHIKAKTARDGEEAADDHLAEFVGLLPPFAIPDVKRPRPPPASRSWLSHRW
jgi:hypothetical protein